MGIARSMQRSPVPDARSRTTEPGGRRRSRTARFRHRVSSRNVMMRLTMSYRGDGIEHFSNRCALLIALRQRVTLPWPNIRGLGRESLSVTVCRLRRPGSHRSLECGQTHIMIDFSFPPDVEEVRLRVREFMDTRVRPEWEQINQSNAVRSLSALSSCERSTQRMAVVASPYA